jgi:hypothetical protein
MKLGEFVWNSVSFILTSFWSRVCEIFLLGKAMKLAIPIGQLNGLNQLVFFLSDF